MSGNWLRSKILRSGSGRASQKASMLPASLHTSSGSAWQRAPGAESRCRRCRQLAGLRETPLALRRTPEAVAPTDPLPPANLPRAASARPPQKPHGSVRTTSGLSVPGGPTLWSPLPAPAPVPAPGPPRARARLRARGFSRHRLDRLSSRELHRKLTPCNPSSDIAFPSSLWSTFAFLNSNEFKTTLSPRHRWGN